jgi:hypothetical protein
MTQPTDGMLSKIRGLLAQAEHPATSKVESETFMAAATRLMAKYGVERAMLGALHPETDRVGDRVVVVPGPYAMGKMHLLYSIAGALGVQGVKLRPKAAGTQELHLFGMESDMERVDMLFTSLLLQCVRFMEQDARDNWAAQANPKVWKRDYIEGFRGRVSDRLKEAEERARRQAEADRTSGPSVALVVQTRAERAQAALRAKYPNTTNAKSRRQVGTGYIHGTRAGNRADLGGSRVGGGRRALA